MGKNAFDKFINKPEGGAKKKEKIRQEKKKAREEKNAWFDEQKRLAKERKRANQRPDGQSDDRRQKPEAPTKSGRTTGTKRELQSGSSNRGKAPLRETGRFQKSVRDDKRSKPTGNEKSTYRSDDRKPIAKNFRTRPTSNAKPAFRDNDRKTIGKNIKGKPAQATEKPNNTSSEDEMPLNKFIAWCGVCGRREAVDLIKEGKVTVNGTVITNPPHRVSRTDAIKVNGKKVSVQKNLVYILLNKPKDYITTTDDPEGRKTVMDIVRNATDERVFPVGRLDRNTTGVLLLTNDGEVAQRMTHPKYEVKKIYEVKLDKVVTKQQLETIAGGIKLDDGFIQPDTVAYADAKDKSVIGIEIHSGRNRIVRRIFEKLGFKVKNLDRVMYGIFTKKNVDRGKWRFLSEKEIRLLKHLNTSFAPKKSTR